MLYQALFPLNLHGAIFVTRFLGHKAVVLIGKTQSLGRSHHDLGLYSTKQSVKSPN